MIGLKEVISVIDITNGKQALLCFRFVFGFPFLNDENSLLISAEIDRYLAHAS